MLPFDRLRAGCLLFVVSCEPVEQSNYARLACVAFYEACPEFTEGPPNLACFSTFYEFVIFCCQCGNCESRSANRPC